MVGISPEGTPARKALTQILKRRRLLYELLDLLWDCEHDVRVEITSSELVLYAVVHKQSTLVANFLPRPRLAKSF